MINPPTLQIGLLLCDDVDETASERYGTYAEMFQKSIDATAKEILLTPIRCHENELLPDSGKFDGYVISGSRYGVYDGYPWIGALMDFVRQCWARDIRMVGICFGHQLIAHALGGKTEKADVGWGFGIHSAKLTQTRPWMTNTDELNGDLYNLVVIHQDQVVKLPQSFRTIAENEFCPNSMIVADGKMLGIQGHPEFSKAFCAFRAEFRRDTIGESVYQSTLHSLSENDLHAPTVLQWVNNFLMGKSANSFRQ